MIPLSARSHPTRSRRFVVCVVVAVFWAAGAGAGAQEAEPDRPAKEESPAAKPDYRGATPGQSSKPRHLRKNALSWIGFQVRDDGSARVFLRLANELPFEQSVRDGVVVVSLVGARYRHSNTRRPLDVRFFGTALERISSKSVSRRRKSKDRPERKAGIEVYLHFKRKEDARPASAVMKTEPDGYTYLYLDVPAPAPVSEGTITVSEPDAGAAAGE